MLEESRENYFGELLRIINDEGSAIFVPTDELLILPGLEDGEKI
eukprot:CAMPEP_0176445116 /NCGR_PEP_ID=MMETSP0127-20121128/23488_1 /TAXON_ID=938130 /ORGANISM="Platyophrya macrostoma, Strain WH" /LENGTH=43 /DNA_ID= /DNA_START= /DNA_END= /DNA_ORIENTATION=